MVVKSKAVFEHLGDLDNTFNVLRKYKLHLNTSKCSFGVGSGKFLGYMVTHRGIEVNLDQIKAINDLKPPRNTKEVQKLTGIIATLNLFISRLADRCRPVLSLDQQVERIRMVRGLCCDLPTTQGIPITTTYHVKS